MWSSWQSCNIFFRNILFHFTFVRHRFLFKEVINIYVCHAWVRYKQGVSYHSHVPISNYFILLKYFCNDTRVQKDSHNFH